MIRRAGLSSRSTPISIVIFFCTVLLEGQGLPECGTPYAPPFAPEGGKGDRPCGQPTPRQYKPQFTGLAYRLLEDESEACFVPDVDFQLLDRLVLATRERHAAAGRPGERETLSLIGNVLEAHGFGLKIPTDTLADALWDRATGSQPERHNFDCDTGSVIYMTIAENVGIKLSLVDITLSSGTGHSYVRWIDARGRPVDWDVNGRCECRTPSNGQLPHQGKPMTDAQVVGYFKGIKGLIFRRQENFSQALVAYREAGQLYPEAPWAWNGLAWLISTRALPNRDTLKGEALSAARRAVSIKGTANYLDTLACAHALSAQFDDAIKVEERALASVAIDVDFQRRLALFKSGRDCTGE